jgi:ABC-type transport system involved in multi-copper enzyme maturation permease subunit
MGNSLKQTLAKKFISYWLWTILAFVIFYLIGSAFNFIPQSIQDIVNWGSENFTTIVFAICFLTAAWLIERILESRKPS